MIQYDARYFNNAHRISDVAIDPSVTVLYDGQWMTISPTNTAVISAGGLNNKSFMTISSKWGSLGASIGAPITTPITGRDNVTPTGTVALLMGPYRVETDQFDATKTYVNGAALKVSTTVPGVVTPFIQGTDDRSLVVGYVFNAPAVAGDMLTIAHE